MPTSKDRIYKAFTTVADNKCVAFGWTDGQSYWLTDLNDARISEFVPHRAGVTIAVRRTFGRTYAADQRIALFPGQEFVRSHWSWTSPA